MLQHSNYTWLCFSECIFSSDFRTISLYIYQSWPDQPLMVASGAEWSGSEPSAQGQRFRKWFGTCVDQFSNDFEATLAILAIVKLSEGALWKGPKVLDGILGPVTTIISNRFHDQSMDFNGFLKLFYAFGDFDGFRRGALRRTVAKVISTQIRRISKFVQHAYRFWSFLNERSEKDPKSLKSL